jgi:hypothetical protein
MHAERRSGIVDEHSLAAEEFLEARAEVLGPHSNAPILRQPAERKGRVGVRGHDVGRVARTPDLDEGRVIQGVGRYLFDPGMQGVRGRSRDAVLQAGPCGVPKRIRTGREALIERLDPAPVGKDRPPRELEHGLAHRFQAGSGGSGGADPSGQAAIHTRLPARSARIHDRGAAESSTTRPPAARAAARRSSACSRATDTSMCIACRSGLASSSS